VLSLLARQPRRAHDVAWALSGAGPGTAADRYQEALTTLDRLRDAGLVRRRAAATDPLYEITRRGRSELCLQRLLWASLVAGGATPKGQRSARIGTRITS
jgi:DNA-binding PadR family transcriptional regulator